MIRLYDYWRSSAAYRVRIALALKGVDYDRIGVNLLAAEQGEAANRARNPQGLVPTLESKGPFTVFAPTNKAFGALPSGTVDNLLKPENKDKLTKVLTYHVLPGKFDSKAVMAAIKAGDGKVSMKTVEGDMLTFKMNGKNLEVWDENGGHATVTTADVYQSNGVIHVVDSVLLPKM